MNDNTAPAERAYMLMALFFILSKLSKDTPFLSLCWALVALGFCAMALVRTIRS